MEALGVAEQGRCLRHRCGDMTVALTIRLIVIRLIVILRKADGRSFASGKLSARNHAQSMRSRHRLDSFDHREISRRLHPEHRRDTRRIEVRIDDRDLHTLERERRCDIHREHAFADAAPRTGKRNRRTYPGEVCTNPLPPIRYTDGLLSRALGIIIAKYPHTTPVS